MGQIANIDDRARRVTAALIREQLLARGSAHASIAVDLTIPIETWRLLAREVARDLGRPVHTLVAGDTVRAVLTDWPSTDAERMVRDAILSHPAFRNGPETPLTGR